MVNISVNSIPYRLKDQWRDITLQEAIELYKLAMKIPEYIRDAYGEQLKDEPDQKRIDKLLAQITIEDQRKHLPTIYGEMIELLSNIPSEVLNNIWSEQRKAVYDRYLSPLVLGLLFWPNFESNGKEYFTHKGKRYYLPKSLELFGYNRPGVDLTALEFCEYSDLQIASDHMEEGRLAHASKIIAILCRPEGEKYDEVVCGRRSNEFLTLTMDKVWEVFFSLIDSAIILQQRSLLSTLQAENQAESGLKSKLTVGMRALLKLPKRAPSETSSKSKNQTLMTS